MLQQSDTARTREFVLVFGGYGAGKSDNLAQVADLYRRTDTPGQFHIISTEYERWERTAEGYPDFDQNCTIYETHDWESLADVSAKVAPQLTRDDWIVVDSIGNAQTWCRDVHFNGRFGRGFRDWQSLGGKATDVGPAFWQMVDQDYQRWLLDTFVKVPAHRYAVAQADQIRTEAGTWSDSKEIKQLFGRLGYKPVGNKNLGYVFHSVLYASTDATGYYLTTVKEGSKNREYLENARVEVLTDAQRALQDSAGVVIPYGFVQVYLLNVAHWSIT